MSGSWLLTACGWTWKQSLQHSPYNALFVVTYLVIGVLFVMNLFVGFIVDGFNANKV